MSLCLGGAAVQSNPAPSSCTSDTGSKRDRPAEPAWERSCLSIQVLHPFILRKAP